MSLILQFEYYTVLNQQNKMKYFLEKYTMCKKLLDIVKDADALDRFRLSAHSLNPRFLRTESAKSMIQAAFVVLVVEPIMVMAVPETTAMVGTNAIY